MTLTNIPVVLGIVTRLVASCIICVHEFFSGTNYAHKKRKKSFLYVYTPVVVAAHVVFNRIT